MKKLQQIVFVFTELFSMAVDDFGAKFGTYLGLIEINCSHGNITGNNRKTGVNVVALSNKF